MAETILAARYAPAEPPRDLPVTDPHSFDAALEAVADIGGWMTPAQARLLWDSARALRPGERAVEIGSYQGRSTVVLARAVPEGASVVAIDPHAGTDRGPQEITGKEAEAESDSQLFQRNLADAGVAASVRYLREWSQDALDQLEGPVELLYIDGAHRYGPARDDIVRWGERVVPGGTLLIHDSFSSVGVTGAILTTLVTSPKWRYLGRAGSMTEYRRSPLGPVERVTDALHQLAELPWFARNVLFKVLITLKQRPLAIRLGLDPDQAWPY
jgi:predicted O-methyltransferase YrrM